MRSISIFLAFITANLLPQAPDSPKELRPPVNPFLLQHLVGKGDQIYVCQSAAGVYSWKLKAPDAILFDEHGQLVGKHFAGPTWELTDGSRVTGSVVNSVPSPDRHSIPWLLLSAQIHGGSGAMSRVVNIQRLGTVGGGVPAMACGRASTGQEKRVAYQADYYFYGTAGKH